MLQIVRAPNPVLSEIARPVGQIDKNILKLIEEMKKTLDATRDPEGVGLAAPQVGKSLRIFIMKPTPKSEATVCINPFILGKSEVLAPLKRPKKSGNKKAGALEGCLSLKDIWGPVLRSPHITIQYTDEKGVTKTKTLKGFSATIAQHEIDHLEGILFPKLVLEQKGTLYKSHKNKKGEDVFEPIEL